MIVAHVPWVVLAMGLGNLPAVRIWTTKIGLFGSRPVQKPDPLPVGRPNPDLYPSTHGFAMFGYIHRFQSLVLCFGYHYSMSHSDMLLLIAKY